MIDRWNIVTIGNLSRNRYWGESDAAPVRPALCTCTCVTSGHSRLLVDPSVADSRNMAVELARRTGMQPADITTVFITHAHTDHHAGLSAFPDAEWLAAPTVAKEINETGRYAKPVMPATDRILDTIDVLGTPGHAPGHHSLRFDWNGYRIVVAGDAVMTRDFWLDRQGYFNSVDFDLVADTMDHLAGLADIIVPGHDNYFLVAPGSHA